MTRATLAVGQQHTSPLRARCEARRRKLLFVVVIVAWRAMPPWLLKLMTGFGRAAPLAATRGDTRHQAPCESPAAS